MRPCHVLRQDRRSSHLPCLLILVVSLLVQAGCVREAPPGEPQEVRDTLVALLEDPEPDVRRTAALSLGKLGLTGAAGPLIGALDDPDARVRTLSADALGTLGEGVMDQAALPLAGRLRDPSDEVKHAAARALAAIGGTQVVLEIVAESLSDPDSETRLAAALALGGLEASSAYSALVETLRDHDGRVRQAAVSALGELADRRALPFFRERLLSDPVPAVRSEAAYRLGKLGTADDQAVLQAVAERDPAVAVRWWAKWAAEQLSPVGASG